MYETPIMSSFLVFFLLDFFPVCQNWNKILDSGPRIINGLVILPGLEPAMQSRLTSSSQASACLGFTLAEP